VSCWPLKVRAGPIFVGNVDSSDFVYPVIKAHPLLSIAMPSPPSPPSPPMKPQYSNMVPFGFSLATKASPIPLNVKSGPTLFGKVVSEDKVTPVIYALPLLSTVIPHPISSFSPPMNPQYTNNAGSKIRGLLLSN